MGIVDLTMFVNVTNVTLIDEDGADTSRTFYWCRPRGVSNGQLVDLMGRELRAHPETRHYAAFNLILHALRTNFPC
jgi:hypothetical protein